MAQPFMVEKLVIERYGGWKVPLGFGFENVMIDKSRVEKFLLALGFKSPGLKLGVEKSRVEMSCNQFTLLCFGSYADIGGPT